MDICCKKLGDLILAKVVSGAVTAGETDLGAGQSNNR